MNLGVVLPRTAIGSDVETVTEYAGGVEAAGYHHLLAYDHVLGGDPERSDHDPDRYDRSNPIHEPLVLFGYLAGATDRLKLVTGVLILPQRQTALVAKQAAEVDVLTEGRLRLGVGVGWNDVEYEALDVDFGKRGARIEEQVDLLRELWTNELVTYEGEFHTIPDAGLNPLPVQRPIPIWMGGDADPVLRRVGRLADGWLPRDESPEQVARKLDRIEEHAEAAGRDPSELSVLGRVTLDPDRADEWVDDAAGFREIGCSHLSVNTMGVGYETAAEHLEAVREFADRAADFEFELERRS